MNNVIKRWWYTGLAWNQWKNPKKEKTFCNPFPKPTLQTITYLKIIPGAIKSVYLAWRSPYTGSSICRENVLVKDTSFHSQKKLQLHSCLKHFSDLLCKLLFMIFLTMKTATCHLKWQFWVLLSPKYRAFRNNSFVIKHITKF